MTNIPGSRCAEALVRVGLAREAVVNALVLELDLTRAEAVTAWRTASPRDDEIAAIRRVTRRIAASRPV